MRVVRLIEIDWPQGTQFSSAWVRTESQFFWFLVFCCVCHEYLSVFVSPKYLQCHGIIWNKLSPQDKVLGVHNLTGLLWIFVLCVSVSAYGCGSRKVETKKPNSAQAVILYNLGAIIKILCGDQWCYSLSISISMIDFVGKNSKCQGKEEWVTPLLQLIKRNFPKEIGNREI